MINKLKYNSKIKIISLLSAMVLWMYVMAIVDPEETKLFENIPVTITNKNELNERDLVIYPEQDLTTNIYVTGKLSNLKKVTKDDINVYGQINNPLEGNNEIYLKVSTSQRVNYDFKNPVMIVTLEKIISEDKSIKVDITGSGKNNVDNIMLQDNIDKVSISGPRSLVNKVKRVVGTVKVSGESNNFSQSIKLEPVDANGKVVEGVELEKDSVNVNIILLAQKTVPIILKLSDNSESGVNYTMSQNTVTIKGKKDIVDSINNIETQPVKLSEILPGTSKDIYLQVPSGITIETKYITINKNSEENTLEEYTYTAKDIEIRNNTENIDKSKIKIPNSINVSIEYLQSEGSINKDDIKLYIDLNEVSLEDNTCKIKYESIYDKVAKLGSIAENQLYTIKYCKIQDEIYSNIVDMRINLKRGSDIAIGSIGSLIGFILVQLFTNFGKLLNNIFIHVGISIFIMILFYILSIKLVKAISYNYIKNTNGSIIDMFNDELEYYSYNNLLTEDENNIIVENITKGEISKLIVDIKGSVNKKISINKVISKETEFILESRRNIFLPNDNEIKEITESLIKKYFNKVNV